MSLLRLIRTVRHLRSVQVIDRVRRKFRPAKIQRIRAPPVREVLGGWVAFQPREPSLVSSDAIRVFESTHRVASADDWNAADLPHLVLYNLHYFDDLAAADAAARRAWQSQLIERWIAENPPSVGAGWEPYPLSLRIVNWIKWQLAGNALRRHGLDSLATQVAGLADQLEYHLLGNHLLANAKALVFAGVFFSGPVAQGWLDLGLRILNEQLAEQILEDGGHFELSPMYHSIILEDLLDLLNLAATYPDAGLNVRIPELRSWVQKMRHWLGVMTHPDQQISFFNDAALGIAIAPDQLDRYAGQLGLPDVTPPAEGLNYLGSSGYVRLQRDDAVVVLDVAEVGPRYQPGHAHADTLSMEMSLGPHRVLVNSGTSVYGLGPLREYQRSTAAHSTVEVDQQNSSEVWSGFRVARRASPRDIRLEETAARLIVGCGHDGYHRLSGRVTHHRTWTLEARRLRVADRLTGRFRSAIARFFWHPNVIVVGYSPCDAASGTASGSGEGSVGDLAFRFRIENGDACCVSSTYHPRFEVDQANSCLKSTFLTPVHALQMQW